MGTEFLTAFVAQADEFARRLRVWNEHRLIEQVEQRVAQEKRTIDIWVVGEVETQVSARLAERTDQAIKKDRRQFALERHRVRLNAKRQFQRRFRDEERRKWLDWCFSLLARYGDNWVVNSLVIANVAIVCLLIGINVPPGVICTSQKTLCYQARFQGMKTSVADIPPVTCTQSPEKLICLYKKKTLKFSPKPIER